MRKARVEQSPPKPWIVLALRQHWSRLRWRHRCVRQAVGLPAESLGALGATVGRLTLSAQVLGTRVRVTTGTASGSVWSVAGRVEDRSRGVWGRATSLSACPPVVSVHAPCIEPARPSGVLRGMSSMSRRLWLSMRCEAKRSRPWEMAFSLCRLSRLAVLLCVCARPRCRVARRHALGGGVSGGSWWATWRPTLASCNTPSVAPVVSGQVAGPEGA